MNFSWNEGDCCEGECNSHLNARIYRKIETECWMTCFLHWTLIRHCKIVWRVIDWTTLWTAGFDQSEGAVLKCDLCQCRTLRPRSPLFLSRAASSTRCTCWGSPIISLSLFSHLTFSIILKLVYSPVFHLWECEILCRSEASERDLTLPEQNRLLFCTQRVYALIWWTGSVEVEVWNTFPFTPEISAEINEGFLFCNKL